MTIRDVPKLWEQLMSFGWVNVTGLTVLVRPISFYGNPYDFIFPLPYTSEGNDFLSGVGYNNDMCVAYPPDGTVWLHTGSVTVQFAPTVDVMPLFRPGFKGNAFVPCSNGEQIDGRLILERIADPFWNGGEVANAENECLGYVRYPATIQELREHPAFVEYLRKAVRACRR